MTTSIIPDSIKMFFKDVRILYLRYRYQRTLKYLRKCYGKRKMKIAFFVSELAKWKGQALYDLMARSTTFEPQIIVYLMTVEKGDSHAEQEIAIAAKVDFFRNKGLSVKSLWNVAEQRFMIEKMSDIDICFYQQPWDIPPAPCPRQIANRTLSFYFPYYVSSYDDQYQLNLLLPHEVFRLLVLNENQKKIYADKWFMWRYCGEMITLGHPFVDLLTKTTVSDFSNQSVIYAPHFSFPIEDHKRLFPASTFLDNGHLLLEFAKNHPEINWVFKPHPLLRRELVDTYTWTKEEVDTYYEEWESIGKACYTSDYIDLFMDSRVMITDCGSFLTEYSCTGHPLIHLIPGKLPVKPNPVVEDLFNYFYQAPNNTVLFQLLDRIVLKGEDPLKEKRIDCLKKIGLLDSNASENIINYIDKLLQ